MLIGSKSNHLWVGKNVNSQQMTEIYSERCGATDSARIRVQMRLNTHTHLLFYSQNTAKMRDTHTLIRMAHKIVCTKEKSTHTFPLFISLFMCSSPSTIAIVVFSVLLSFSELGCVMPRFNFIYYLINFNKLHTLFKKIEFSLCHDEKWHLFDFIWMMYVQAECGMCGHNFICTENIGKSTDDAVNEIEQMEF